VIDLRLVPNMVDLESDPMCRASALDQRLALGAVERERHGENGFERITLRPSGW
jgi:hypothetical protein